MIIICVLTLCIDSIMVIPPNTRDKAMFKLTMKMNWGQLITADFHTMAQAMKYSSLFKCVMERKLSTPHGAIWLL